MKKINKIKGVLLVCSILCACFALLSFNFASAHQEYDFEFSSTLNEQYVLGDEIIVPTATYAGKDADFRIRFPNGNFSNSKEIKLTQYGMYIVEYSAINPNTDRIVKTSTTFSVTGEYFTINGRGTTEFRTLSNGITGVYASLVAGDSITFNDVIDLEKYGPKDLFFKMQFMPATTGESDVLQMEIKFVDAYDENNFITIRVKQYQDSYEWEHASSLVDVSFNDSDYIGLFESSKGLYEYDGVKYRAYKNDVRYGQSVSISMTGSTSNRLNAINGRYPFGFAFDENSGRINSCVYSAYKLISDLHNLNLYGKAFKGFTDNKIKVVITPTVFNKGACGLFFTEFNGVKMTESSYSDFVLTEKPEINLDFGEMTEDAIPKARVSMPYKIFDAKGFSVVFGELPVDVKVFYGYNNVNKVRINLVDGKFLPTIGGVYTIEYTVSDLFGNKTVKTIEVEAFNVEQNFDVEFVNEIDYDNAVNVGSIVKLFDSINCQSDFGEVNTSVSAVLQSDPTVKYDVTKENNYSFRPLYAGIYDIVISVSDYTLTQTIKKELTVEKDTVVIFEKVAQLPKRLIQNGTYDFDVVKAYSLASGKPVEIELELSLFNDANTTPIVVDDLSNVKIEANGKVKLSYKPIGINFDVQPFEEEIAVLRTGLYDKTVVMRNYFYTEEGSARFVADENGVGCEIREKVDGRMSFYFANVLAGHECNISIFPLFIDGVYQPFNRLNYYLYDAKNVEKFVKMSFIEQNGMWFVSVNDGELVKIYDTWGVSEDGFDVSFNSQNDRIVFDNLVAENGIKLYGTNDKAIFIDGINLKFEVIAVNDCQGIKIAKINNQMISSAPSDFTPSTIDMTHDTNAGEKKIGETIKLEKFMGYDVLTPNVKTIVSVSFRKTKQDAWTFIKSVDGVTLRNADASREYEFVLTESGDYNVNVKVVDEIISDNNISRSYTITVNDYSKPVVNITSKTTSGKVGKKINLAKFETEKDLSELSYYFAILDADGYINFTKENTFVAKKAGTYKVTLVVLDANNNMTQVSYDIVVK